MSIFSPPREWLIWSQNGVLQTVLCMWALYSWNVSSEPTPAPFSGTIMSSRTLTVSWHLYNHCLGLEFPHCGRSSMWKMLVESLLFWNGPQMMRLKTIMATLNQCNINPKASWFSKLKYSIQLEFQKYFCFSIGHTYI